MSTSSSETTGFDIGSLEQRLASNPHSTMFARLASLYLTANRLEEARGLCERGIADYPDYATAHLILGQCYVRLRRFKNAREELLKTLRLQPRCEVARKLLEEVTLGLQAEKVREATIVREHAGESKVIETEEQLIMDMPEDAIVSSTLAEIYAAQGAYREAIRTYALLTRRKPEERERFEQRMRELEEKWRSLAPPS